MSTIYFTVTNDLSYDQRMHRICTTLSEAGYSITLVGRKRKNSIPLQQRPYLQKRLPCFFTKSFLFYAEYNLRLFFFLLFRRMDAICAIDLDTILPCLAVSAIKRAKRIYDAHEYFTELKEVRTRPAVKILWTTIERFAVPRFNYGYTVSEGLAVAFREKYGVNLAVVRNFPVLQKQEKNSEPGQILIFQGAVNEARGFEYLIPAMRKVQCKLVVCGDGNFMDRLKKIIAENEVADKVELKGMMLPHELRDFAAKATLGIGLAEKEGINQLYALPNKFLEYMHAGLPQISMNFPEYQRINNQYKIAVLINNLDVDTIATTINETMQNQPLLNEMQANAEKAREVYCWQNEQVPLLQYYNHIFNA